MERDAQLGSTNFLKIVILRFDKFQYKRTLALILLRLWEKKNYPSLGMPTDIVRKTKNLHQIDWG